MIFFWCDIISFLCNIFFLNNIFHHLNLQGPCTCTVYQIHDKFEKKYYFSLGFEGEECLLRSICEVADVPMHVKDGETLLEKIVHLVFTWVNNMLKRHVNAIYLLYFRPSLEMYSENRNLTRADNLKFVDKSLLALKNIQNVWLLL